MKQWVDAYWGEDCGNPSSLHEAVCNSLDMMISHVLKLIGLDEKTMRGGLWIENKEEDYPYNRCSPHWNYRETLSTMPDTLRRFRGRMTGKHLLFRRYRLFGELVAGVADT